MKSDSVVSMPAEVARPDSATFFFTASQDRASSF